MCLLAGQPLGTGMQIAGSAMIFTCVSAIALLGWSPVKGIILARERMYETVLRNQLLIDIKPRTATWLSLAGILLMAATGGVLAGWPGALLGVGLGVFLPMAALKFLRRRRLYRLEFQLVPGIQSLASGVRAGLNLVQSMELVARDGPVPLKQEFNHLLREYEYGVPLETAMNSAAERIGSSDFRLLFAALLTHRERGGNLGETLDRIADSIREIQRLEKQVRTLTAQGRATARWLGAMPIVVLLISYCIYPRWVSMLFVEPVGQAMLAMVILLNVVGFLWVKKIVNIDI